jgi:hypothetical protein
MGAGTPYRHSNAQEPCGKTPRGSFFMDAAMHHSLQEEDAGPIMGGQMALSMR